MHIKMYIQTNKNSYKEKSLINLSAVSANIKYFEVISKYLYK